jgi:hypothetical protein
VTRRASRSSSAHGSTRRTHTLSTMPCTISNPSSRAISEHVSRISRPHAQIASWHSIRPNRAFLYAWYPKEHTASHLIASTAAW